MGYAEKRRITTGEIYKYKVRLNAYGGQQVYGIHYWDTYAPVVTWFAICLMLTLVLLHRWSTLMVDFVLAYPQADVERKFTRNSQEALTLAHTYQDCPMYSD